jgi:hypothetical protein
MRGAIHPFPQYAFIAWCLVKHRDNFTFYLYLHGGSDSLYLHRTAQKMRISIIQAIFEPTFPVFARLVSYN